MSVLRGTGGNSPGDGRGDLLRLHLQTFVPLRVIDLARLSWEERIARCREHGETLAAHSDDLLFGGKHCREALKACVDGVAALSFCPGGVDLFGEHFEAERILEGFGLGADGSRKDGSEGDRDER